MASQLLWKCGGGGATHSYTYGSPGGTRYRLHKARPFERVLAGATNGNGNFIFHHTAGVVFLLCKSKQQFLVDLLVVISSFWAFSFRDISLWLAKKKQKKHLVWDLMTNDWDGRGSKVQRDTMRHFYTQRRWEVFMKTFAFLNVACSVFCLWKKQCLRRRCKAEHSSGHRRVLMMNGTTHRRLL